jgi:hypothetical protein
MLMARAFMFAGGLAHAALAAPIAKPPTIIVLLLIALVPQALLVRLGKHLQIGKHGTSSEYVAGRQDRGSRLAPLRSSRPK